MVFLKSFEAGTDGVCATLIEDEMYEEEADVSTIVGATKAVGNGWIDSLPSVSSPVLIIWPLRQSFTGRPSGDRLTPTVPGTLSGATVVGGN